MNTNNEDQIINILNENRISSLNSFWKNQIKELFHEDDESAIVIARNVFSNSNYKSDIEIEVKKQKLRVSIKSGSMPILHQEKADYFLSFLSDIGVSQETVNLIVIIAFNDGTSNGTGNKEDFSFKEFYNENIENIKKASEELSEPDVIRAITLRTLYKIRKEGSFEVDYLYYGNADYGIFVSRNELIKQALEMKTNHYKGLHSGPLFIRRKHQVEDPYKQYKYETILLTWPTLYRDVNTIKKSRRCYSLF